MKKLALLGVFLLLALSLQTAHASTACAIGDKFSSETGLPCTVSSTCAPGDLYSSETGLPCSTAYLPGCVSTVGYSVTTGHKCDGSVSEQDLITKINQFMNQQSTQQNTQPAAPVDNSAVAPVPVINKSLPNNFGQVYIIKTNVPTTVTIQYVDQNALIAAQGPNFTGLATDTYPGGMRGLNELLISYLSNPDNVLTYTDTTLTTDHEIPYSTLNLIPNHSYDTKVTVTDENGNTANYSYQNSVGFPGTNGDPDGILNNWAVDSLSTNKNA